MNLKRAHLRNPRTVDFVIMTLGCLIPLIPLVDFHYNFAFDWTNHLYFIAYFGEYFRQHFTFPSVINTRALFGWPIPIFYGFSFYSFCGVLSSVLGAALAYRVFVIAMSFIQYALVKQVTLAYGGNRFLSHAFALFMTWGIYPLTNLYNRSATTEYAAVIALNCGFFCWLLLVRDPAKWKNTLVPWVFGFFFALSAGSHPITAFYGAITFVLFWIVTFLAADKKKYLLKLTFLSGAAISLVLSPWIYAVLKYRRYLQISMIANKIWMSPAIDGFFTRINLFPYDPRLPSDSTPHLDAQMNMPFLIFALIALTLIILRLRKKTFSKMSWLAIASGLLFVTFFFLSTYEHIWDIIPREYHIVQMAYRLVSYINLTVFIFAIGLLELMTAKERTKKFLVVTMSVLVVVSFEAMAVKLRRATNVYQWPNFEGLVDRRPEALSRDIPFSNQNMARSVYATNGLFRHFVTRDPLVGEMRIPLLEGEENFGIPRSISEDSPTGGWYVTNVQSFPWNRIAIDKILVNQDDTIDFNNSLTVQIPPGPHEIEYLFIPDLAWKILKNLSILCFFGWFTVILVRFPFTKVRA